MSPRNAPIRPSRRFGALGGPILIVALALGGVTAGCTGGAQQPATTGDAGVAGTPASPGAAVAATPRPPEAAVPLGHMHMPTADEVTTAWKARPAYVEALSAEWQGAYAYALARPDVLQWLPCYCGCTGMGHRSNLDCFFQRREVAGSYVFEEHASYCDICVETANLAQRLLGEGRTMLQVRAAVDSTFGGAAPGTDTPLPPAS